MALDGYKIFVFLAITAAIKLIRYFFFGKSKSINPFSEIKLKPVKEKVTDKKARDSVLKQNFSKKVVPEDLDAIVIGSGIGGLTTAVLLSDANKKVLVLEQHDQAGGCCHSFIDKGYEFDVGIHYIGTMQYQSIAKTLTDHITGGQLTWDPMDDVFDEIVFAEKDKPVRKYKVIGNKTKWSNYLKEKFPGEEDNIDKFFGYLKEVSTCTQSSMAVKFMPMWLVKLLNSLGLMSFVSKYWYWNQKTAAQVVNEVTNNQELRDIFCYCFGDYGTTPDKAGFPMQALLLNHFLDKGASYPIGGASEIAFHIIPRIEEAGGKVLVRANVTNILMSDDGKACGVRVKKGSEEYDIKAPMIISAAGVLNTKKMLPESVVASSPMLSSLNLAQGSCMMSLFIGIDRPAKDLDIISKKNYWAFTGNDLTKICEEYMSLSQEEALDADVPLLFISFPSTKDPEWEKRYPGKTTLAIITLTKYEWFKEWENKPCMRRGDDYESIKKTIGQRMLDQTVNLFPSIKDHIDYVNIGSPLSNNYYIGTNQGEAYGLDHSAERFNVINTALLRPQTDVPGLYLSGQDICGCGFVGGLWGGVLGAAAALGRNIFNDLPGLQKSVLEYTKKDKNQ